MIRRDVRVHSGAPVWVYDHQVPATDLWVANVVLLGEVISGAIRRDITLEDHQNLVEIDEVLFVCSVTLDSFTADPEWLRAPMTRLILAELTVTGVNVGSIARAAGPYVGALRNAFVRTDDIVEVP